MGAAADLLEQVHEDGEAHEHLLGACPWYRHVHEGGGEAAERHCRPAGSGKALVKFTPHTAEASTVPQPTVPPGGPGLFHVKGMELPPYIQHLYKHLVGRYGKHGAYRVAVGVVKKWAAGVNPGGYDTKSGKGKRTHPDVRAAAAKNVAEWEEKRARAHAQSAAHGHASPYEADLALAGPAQLPGAQSQYGLVYRRPMMTGAQNLVPPRAELPTPTEVRVLAGLVPPTGGDTSLTRTIRVFLETAAVKLEKNSPLDALAALRGAQSAVYSAHKSDVKFRTEAAYPSLTAAVAPPAAQSSATSAMKQSHDKTVAYRRLDQQVAALVDRIRRNFFRGVYAGPSSETRLSLEDPMSATEHLLALAQREAAGHDVSEPVTTDTSGQTPLLEAGEDFGNVTGEASRELAEMTALDRTRVSAYIGQARKMRPSNPAGAAQAMSRAATIAHEAGCRHLVRHLHQHIEALASMGNAQTSDQAWRPPGARNSPAGANARLCARLAQVSD